MYCTQKHYDSPSSNLISSIWRFSVSIIVASFLLGCSSPAKRTPIPKGLVEINIQFNNISTAEFNVLNKIIEDLASKHSTSITEGNTFHGYFNDGFAYLRYRPNHAVPDPVVEKEIKTHFDTLLLKAKIDPKKMTIDVQYGK